MARRRRRMTLLKEQEADLTILPALATPSPEMLADASGLFLHLCSWTVPHGGEDTYYGPMLADLGFKSDGLGNWWFEISNGDQRPETCFMCHLDTSGHEAAPIKRYIAQSVCYTDGKSILGADDRAGLAIILHMVAKDVPGLYYLFVGEEVGCIGSMRAAKSKAMPLHIKRAISFDRKGKDSIVTHQCGQKCCSREFALALTNELNAYGMTYAPDPTGLFTDSLEFAETVPECTNISVGYYDQHSNKERQDLAFLAYLAEVCTKIDWEGLPTERHPMDDDDYGCSYRYGWSDEGRIDMDYWSDHTYEASQKRGYRDYVNALHDAAFDAMDELIENFQLGLPVDPRLCGQLVMPRDEDTTELIEMLLDQLQRDCFLGRRDEV
jgi:hypothetical protein